ncbi:MBL fold metallo-hydrolase (plasmid) [Natrinema thermotolerans]|nr:MBL fold metallo-hydrolase [Natrinema thermotolerans]
MIVTPRGGDREVGRGCYLVDCGLNQGGGDNYPDFRGLGPGSVDAVFLTHAHIDHYGGLPVLEARGYLDDDAPIIATRPTIDLTKTLLEDSLKIHRRETNRHGDQQQFTQQDVMAVFDRFEPVNYGGGRVGAVAEKIDRDPLVYQLGNAAHLLGSAWLMLQTEGYRVVFSGNLGGRASHLPDITPPPQADILFLESTYGGTHSHTSFSDADRRAILEDADPAAGGKIPVIVAPSGMLTGGNSPRYLVELAARFHSATVMLTGYQALQTTGRTIQNQVDAEAEEIQFTTDAEPFGTDWPAADNVTWISPDGAAEPTTRVTMPSDWVSMVGGLSGHAAQPGLLDFARTVDPETIALIHGPDYAQEHLGNHLAKTSRASPTSLGVGD